MTMEDFRLFHEDNFDSFSKKTIKATPHKGKNVI